MEEININENKKIAKKENIIYKKIKFSDDIILIKSIFREYRSLNAIKNLSEYLIQLIDVQLNLKNKEIRFVFSDEGVDLYSLINSQIFNYKEQQNLIKWILFQVLKGLESLHYINIIHRDLNSQHILISSKGGIKIIGFSRSINDIEAKFVNDKIVGNLSYISPEILIGVNNFNNKIDIWSVGVLMMELYYKKNNVLINNDDNPKDSYYKRCFNQIKYLSNFFEIPFNFNYDEKNNQKEYLISWLNSNSVKFIKEKFDKKFRQIPDIDEDGLNLLRRLLAFNPKDRINAREALKSDYFKEYQNLNKDEHNKKNKPKNNENLPIFLKNLEKEFEKVKEYPEGKRLDFFKRELNKICQNKNTEY